MPKLIQCPNCDGAGGDCLLCMGEGQITEFDFHFKEATIRANKTKREFQQYAEKKTKDEVLASSYSHDPMKEWTRAPENCKTTLVAFAEEWPECVPKGSKSFLIKTAKSLVTELGETEAPKFVHWASAIIRNEKPELIDSMKSLDSLSFLLGKWRREHGDRCPACGKGMNECTDEWGARKRREKYASETAFWEGE